MANDLNRVMLIGRLTRDPELRFTPNGAAIAKFSMATNRSYTVNNEKKEEVSYIDVTAWGKFGEMIAQYYKKGQRVAVEGRLQQNRWEQDGQKRSKIEIVADNTQILSYNDDNGGSGGQAQSNNRQSSYQSNPPASQQSSNYSSNSGGGQSVDNNPFSDDDIPF